MFRQVVLAHLSPNLLTRFAIILLVHSRQYPFFLVAARRRKNGKAGSGLAFCPDKKGVSVAFFILGSLLEKIVANPFDSRSINACIRSTKS